MILQFTRVGWIIHAPQTCYWCFKVRKVLLNALGGALSSASHGELQIQRMSFFLKLLSGIIPTHFNFLYKANGDIISPFSQVFRFSEISHIRTPHTFFKTQNIPTLFFFFSRDFRNIFFKVSEIIIYISFYKLIFSQIYSFLFGYSPWPLAFTFLYL